MPYPYRAHPSESPPMVITDASRSFNKRRMICLLLHGLLIAVHIVLLVAHFLQLENLVVVDIGRPTNMLTLEVILIPQAIITTMTAVLVPLAQHLASERELHCRQLLVSIHDQSASWLGLGPAVLTLARQNSKIRPAAYKVLLIVLYFSGFFAMNITTPILFQVEPMEMSQLTSRQLQSISQLEARDTDSVRSRLTINMAPAMAGLVFSCIVQIAALILTRPPPAFHPYPAPTSAGVLQLAWLFGRNPPVVMRVAATTDVPSTRLLRRAGAFEVDLAAPAGPMPLHDYTDLHARKGTVAPERGRGRSDEAGLLES